MAARIHKNPLQMSVPASGKAPEWKGYPWLTCLPTQARMESHLPLTVPLPLQSWFDLISANRAKTAPPARCPPGPMVDSFHQLFKGKAPSFLKKSSSTGTQEWAQVTWSAGAEAGTGSKKCLEEHSLRSLDSNQAQRPSGSCPSPGLAGRGNMGGSSLEAPPIPSGGWGA